MENMAGIKCELGFRNLVSELYIYGDRIELKQRENNIIRKNVEKEITMNKCDISGIVFKLSLYKNTLFMIRVILFGLIFLIGALAKVEVVSYVGVLGIVLSCIPSLKRAMIICKNDGTVIKCFYAKSNEQKAQNISRMLCDDNQKIIYKKNFALIAGVVLLIGMLVFIIQQENEIGTVRDGHFNGFPEKTVGEAFEDKYDVSWDSNKNGEIITVIADMEGKYEGKDAKIKAVFLVSDNSVEFELEKVYVDGKVLDEQDMSWFVINLFE